MRKREAPCRVCGDPHAVVDSELRAALQALGYTSRDIIAIQHESASTYQPLEKSDLDHRKLVEREAARRYRARKKAENLGVSSPSWARKRKTSS